MTARTVSIVGLCLALCSAPALGHHSHAMYDSGEPVLIKGTVKEFVWSNPHCWLYVVVSDGSGQVVEWSLEMGSTADAARNGWRPKIVAPGDTVSIALHPLKSDLRAEAGGRNVGSLAAIALPNGMHIGDAAYFK
jgi:hypothetical protein